ncbi:hypothetical protein ACFL59_02775 [Planctomycetota bacterium]
MVESAYSLANVTDSTLSIDAAKFKIDQAKQGAADSFVKTTLDEQADR